MQVKVIPPEEWGKHFSEQAHLVAFGKSKPAHFDRIDYALLVVDGEKPLGYVTCRELDHETVYWQFGGAMPGTRGTLHTPQVFDAMLTWARKLYRRVTFVVENTNQAMLKLAIHRQFLIVGCRFFHGTVLVEHMLEFKERG